MNHSLSSGSNRQVWNRLKLLSFALSILSLTACQSVQNPEKLSRTLSVSGKGDVSIPTTMTQVSLGVEVQGKTSQEVQQLVAQKSAAVVALLKSRKEVEKLETTGIGLNPIYSYKNNEQRLTGYSGNNTVSFRIETEKAGSLLDDAIKAGATRINGIRLVATENAIAEAQQQAIKEAAEDAKKQADALLGAMKLSQQEVIGIQVNEANPPEPLMRAMTAALPAAQTYNKAANTSIIGGEQDVKASVTLQIRY